jgi:hypothetical protein
MTKQEMLTKINELVIYEKDYNIIRVLLNNTSDEFFVKVIEEVLLGNLYFSDFERILPSGTYETIIKQNLESQENLRKEIERTIAFRRQIENANYDIDLKNTRLGVFLPDEGSDLYNFYKEEELNVIENNIYELLETIPTDNDLVRTAKFKIYDALNKGEISKEDFLLFAKDYIVPISFEHQILDKTDINFMVENSLTEEQVKKLKALSIYIKKLEL